MDNTLTTRLSSSDESEEDLTDLLMTQKLRAHQARCNARMRLKRQNETAEQKEQRRQKAREYDRRKREERTPEQIEAYRKRKREIKRLWNKKRKLESNGEESKGRRNRNGKQLDEQESIHVETAEYGSTMIQKFIIKSNDVTPVKASNILRRLVNPSSRSDPLLVVKDENVIEPDTTHRIGATRSKFKDNFLEYFIN